MSEYFSEPKPSERKVKAELDLYKSATKADLKNATVDDASKLAKKADLESLKSELDKFEINKLKNVPSNLNNLKGKRDKVDIDELVSILVDLSKLSDVAKNDVVKNMYIIMLR